jgi:plasmid stabilization system protein ParE
LQQEWSAGIAENFIIECYSKINLIAEFPHLGTVSDKIKTIRRIFITKHNALYYAVEDNTIILLDIFDTRQNPKKSMY